MTMSAWEYSTLPRQITRLHMITARARRTDLRKPTQSSEIQDLLSRQCRRFALVSASTNDG